MHASFADQIYVAYSWQVIFWLSSDSAQVISARCVTAQCQKGCI